MKEKCKNQQKKNKQRQKGARGTEAIVKGWELECRCLKIWNLLSFLICSSILVLKWWPVSPMKLELQLAQVNVYTRKDFKSLGIGSLYQGRRERGESRGGKIFSIFWSKIFFPRKIGNQKIFTGEEYMRLEFIYWGRHKWQKVDSFFVNLPF